MNLAVFDVPFSNGSHRLYAVAGNGAEDCTDIRFAVVPESLKYWNGHDIAVNVGSHQTFVAPETGVIWIPDKVYDGEGWGRIGGEIMENKNVFHERLTELMIEKGVNTVSLAAAIGVSDETVRRWKNGERDILLSQLVKLADYFQCSLDLLTGRSDTVLDYQVREMPPFYDSLRAVMAEKGVTRYKLVKDLPIYDGYFTNWKKGKSPNILTLIMLADYLDVTIDYLVGREK